MEKIDTESDLDLKKNFIQRQACFSQFRDKEVELLAQLFEKKFVKSGETIVNEGDDVDSVFLIVSGLADVKRLRVVNNTIQNEHLTTLTEGDAIGLNETGFYSLSGKRTATVVAKTDMVLLALRVAAFHGFALSQSRVNNIMRLQARKYFDTSKA